ncbi:MAG: hypothetical protein KDK10_07815 [Maritimibacter sp.]|nr:hypothetical protein [Maritimibacter sp.]
MAGTEWRATRLALIALQWLLVFWGLALIALALNTYAYETAYFATLPAAAPGADNYRPPVRQRMMTGVGTGLATAGIGAALIYLRRVFLRNAA